MRRLVMSLILSSSLVACSKEAATTSAPPTTATGSATTPAKPMHKDVAKAKAMIAAGATVIDVRSTEEYGAGHVGSATNIPVQQFADRIGEVDKLVGGDKTKPIVVYCAKGGRAHAAQTQLEALGFTNVVNGGGLDDLQ
ncbi:MAG: rhodanese-like domain-containing protein [Proteobacteria bacterium]|nr:rhodanese-like domain-containing protein [Pseudomonadota bacterium]